MTEPEGARVIPRGGHVNRLIELQELEGDVLRAAISHLFLRRCLKIGDSGFHNVLKCVHGD
jgi:hypothetical protein